MAAYPFTGHGLSPDKESFAAMVREALYTGKIIAYAQGLLLIQDASRLYGWNLDLGKIASIFRAGCIIQAVFLNDITHAFEAEPKPKALYSMVSSCPASTSIRTACARPYPPAS